MRYLSGTLTRAQSDNLMQRFQEDMVCQGWGIWALEDRQSLECIGFTGLAYPTWEAHFTPCVEIGWRLRYESWGFGYASEAARAALGYAFKTLRLQQLYAFTAKGNARSRAVMERIGMTAVAGGDFRHPNLPLNSPISQHVLYRKLNHSAE